MITRAKKILSILEEKSCVKIDPLSQGDMYAILDHFKINGIIRYEKIGTIIKLCNGEERNNMILTTLKGVAKFNIVSCCQD